MMFDLWEGLHPPGTKYGYDAHGNSCEKSDEIGRGVVLMTNPFESNFTESLKDDLIKHAQSVLTDERHWTLSDVVDRAENAHILASAVLQFFDAEENTCSGDCKDCTEHEANLK